MLLKQPHPASRFMGNSAHKRVQRLTNTAIIHTRAATTGDPADNDNNHPIVVQADGEAPGIVGIHNGVLWNDTELWKQYQDLAAEKVGEVDSQLIFQILSRQGRDGLDQLEGDASIAWMPLAAPHELNVARMGGRPLVATTTPGGSFIFASTGKDLLNALSYFKPLGTFKESDVVDFAEGDWVTVIDGEVVENGCDFPVITISRSYTYSKNRPAPSTPSTASHRPTWYDDWDDDSLFYGGSRASTETTQTSGGALLPFGMSEADRRTWERSMEQATEVVDEILDVPSGAPSSTASSDDSYDRFDRDFFHFVTRGVFLGTDIDPEVISSFCQLIYSNGDEQVMNELLDRFCDPNFDASLQDEIALEAVRARR